MRIVDQTLCIGRAATLRGSQKLHFGEKRFATQAFSVMRKSAFSIAGNLMVDNRTLLGDTMVRAYMRFCLWQSFLQC